MLKVALKEWDVVCDALLSGRQIMLLRKGGISESIGGFELEHSRFFLFPTFLHQNIAMLKPDFAAKVESHEQEPSTINLPGWAEVADIVKVRDRSQIDALDAEHIWTPPLIDMRFNYKPKNPLYLLLVRAYRLPHPTTIQNTPDYAGCKSWVPLETAINESPSTPSIADEAFAARCESIMRILR